MLCALAVLLTAAAVADTKSEAELVEIGRKLFTERCTECHNANGDKPLETGAALSERRLDDGDMRANIAGRLGKDATDEQREAVRLYIRSFNRYTKKR